MSSEITCPECGMPVLPETTAETGGLCGPCHKGHPHHGAAERAPSLSALLAESVSQTRLLDILEGTLLNCCLVAAEHAACYLEDEKVYGFALCHHVFSSARAVVFTEAGLDQATALRAKQDPDFPRSRLRWSPGDSPHNDLLPFTFAQAGVVFSALENQGLREGIEERIEPMFLRALRETRRARIFRPSVVLMHLDSDFAPEEMLVSAEQFCDEATLAKFRQELVPLREDYLEGLRARVPRY
jgi:hypothetical protein